MVSFKAMLLFSNCVAEWLSLNDIDRVVPDDELYNEMPQFMRMKGFGEGEIFRTMQIITAFRSQHELPVID
jgi:hypothetical protein